MTKPIVFADIKPGDPLSEEAQSFPYNDRRRLAAALRQLCPELTEAETERLSQVPKAGEQIRYEVVFLREMIERELPKLRADQGPAADVWGETIDEVWDEPGDAYPAEDA